MTATILTIDDDRRFLKVLQNVLREDPDFQLVGEAANGEQAIRRIQELQPDVVLVDIVMPTLSGFDTMRRIKHRWPEIKIILVTAHPEPEYAMAAFKNGADGFIEKQRLAGALVRVMRQLTEKRNETIARARPNSLHRGKNQEVDKEDDRFFFVARPIRQYGD